VPRIAKKSPVEFDFLMDVRTMFALLTARANDAINLTQQQEKFCL